MRSWYVEMEYVTFVHYTHPHAHCTSFTTCPQDLFLHLSPPTLTHTHTHTHTHTYTHTHTPHHPYPPSKVAGTALAVMTMSEMKEKCIFFSMCHAWQLGRAVLRAQHTHTNVLDAIKEQQNGIILITGKVSPCRGGSSLRSPLNLYPGPFLYVGGYFLFLCTGNQG